MVSEKDRRKIGWLFILIPTLLIFLFYFYPMLQAFLISLQSGSGTNLKFVGGSNYQRLLRDPVFIEAFKNTLIFLIFQVPIMIVLAMFFAGVLNERTLKWKGIFRTIVYLPSVTSLVAYSLVFKYLFANNGIINNLLMDFHWIDQPILWLSHPVWSKIVIILAITWRWTGYNMIFFLSALQNIEPSIYEAADIDGASAWTKFTRITAPLLKPVILFTTITSTIGTLQLFDETMNITQGGPGNATLTLSQYIYNLGFKYTPDFGYASAVSFVVAVVIIILSSIQLVVGGKNEAA